MTPLQSYVAKETVDVPTKVITIPPLGVGVPITPHRDRSRKSSTVLGIFENYCIFWGKPTHPWKFHHGSTYIFGLSYFPVIVANEGLVRDSPTKDVKILVVTGILGRGIIPQRISMYWMYFIFWMYPLKSNIDTQKSHVWKEIQLKTHHFRYLCWISGVQTEFSKQQFCRSVVCTDYTLVCEY